MYCPLLAIAIHEHPESAKQYTQCLTSDCMWWQEDSEICSITKLTNALSVITSVLVNHKQRGGF
jgi:hypothetical protein